MFRILESYIKSTKLPGSATPPRTLLRFYWHFIRQTKAPYVAMIATCLLVAFADMVIPIIIGRIASVLEVVHSTVEFSDHGLPLVLVFAFVLIVRPFLQGLDLAVRHSLLSPGVTTLIRWQSHWHVIRKDWTFFQNDLAGRVANRVMQTPEAMRDSVISTIRALVFTATYGAVTLILMSLSDWRLCGPVVVWFILYTLFLRYFVPKLGKVAGKRSESRSVVVAKIVDCYSNILTVNLFARVDHEDEYLLRTIADLGQATAMHMRMTALFLLTLNILNAIVLASTALVALWLWQNGLVATAQVATALPLAWQVTNASSWISFEVAGIFDNVGTVYDGMQTIAAKTALNDKPNADVLEVQQGEIRFSRVDFSYGGSDRVISGLNLLVRPGERVGLIGRSGAGKSTLLQLLLRFYDVNNGSILIDGQDIRDVTQDSLRASIGVVAQDLSLLNRSVAENISYGRTGSSMAEIESAARSAHAHKFITGLQDRLGRTGYEAHVGERGCNLSGGQRQRIAISRVFLKNAPILILDEATSALDSEAEAEIQSHLFELMSGKTVLAVAHRLSTIASMDRLVVIDGGRIIEEGTHLELIALKGFYASLWEKQAGGTIE